MKNLAERLEQWTKTQVVRVVNVYIHIYISTYKVLIHYLKLTYLLKIGPSSKGHQIDSLFAVSFGEGLFSMSRYSHRYLGKSLRQL